MAILASTLLIFGVSGCIGVLVDFDHVIAYKKHLDHRFLHKHYLLFAGVIFCGALSCYIRLYFK